MDESSSEPDADALRKALADLVTEGLVPYNVGENGGALLQLAIVQGRRRSLDGTANEAARDEADTEALTSVLSEAVEHPTIRGKVRRLLQDVLPLKEELLGKPIKERRTEAGKNIKTGKKIIKPGTIRTYHEPKALDKLVVALLLMEQEFVRGVTSDAKPDKAGKPKA
jgi:hypothetical protein